MDQKLSRIRQRHIRCFLAVARLGHFGRAAKALAVTQPAVTKTINELEEILGIPLFARGRHGAQPTPEAEPFLRHAAASFDELRRAVESTAEQPSTRLLRLGVLPTVAAGFLPAVLAAYRREWPDVALTVLTRTNRQLLSDLREREVDAAIGRLAEPDQMAGTSFEHLYAESLVVALRPGHPLTGGKSFAPEECRGFPLVLPSRGTILRHGADAFLERYDIVPAAGTVETLSISLGRGLARQGDALWFVSPSVVADDVASGTLAVLRLPPVGLREPVGLLLRSDELPPIGLHGLLQAIRAAGREFEKDAG